MSDELVAIDPVDEIDLWHYASKYYDPVKAKAYYERTKALKGRKAAGPQLSAESRQRQAEGSAYVLDQISTQHTDAQKAAAAKQTARLEKLRADAEATRDRIIEKLTALVKKLQADVKEAIPELKLNEIPASASPKQRAFLEKQNARLTKAHNTAVSKVTKKANAAASDARDVARAEIRAVGTSLKDAVTKARNDYSAASKALADKYSSDLKTELKNIEDQVR